MQHGNQTRPEPITPIQDELETNENRDKVKGSIPPMSYSKVAAAMLLASAAAMPIHAQSTDAEPAASAAEASVSAEAAQATQPADDAMAAPTDSTPATEPVAASAPAPEPAAPAVCELHVFPTLEGQAQSSGWLSGFGIVGAVADAAANANRNVSDADYLRDALGPQFQVSAFQSIDLVAALNLPAGTQVTFEQPIADRDITTEVRTRLTQSTHACYAELIVTQNLYLKRPIYGRSLNNRFIYKDFRNGVTQAQMVRGRGGNGLTQFPPETPEQREAADADLRQAFLANFNEYAARFQ